MRYFLNSAVMTTYGTYRYDPITVDAAREWLARGYVKSTVRYGATAAAIEVLLGYRCEMSAEYTEMEVGDEALVFRLKLPPGYRRPAQDQNLPIQFVKDHHEMGLLIRVE